MELPATIEVRVATPDGVPIENALIWLNTRAMGQDYFRPFIGLTDRKGVTRVTAEALKADFVYNQEFWIMDFRLPLEECDDEVVIGLEGGSVFEEHRRTALEAAWVTGIAKDLWRRACNADLESTSELVPLPASVDLLRIELVARASRPSV